MKHYMRHHLFVPHAALMSYTGAQVLIKTVISAEQQSGVTCLTNIKLQSVFKLRSTRQRPFLLAGKSLPLFINKTLYSFIQFFLAQHTKIQQSGMMSLTRVYTHSSTPALTQFRSYSDGEQPVYLHLKQNQSEVIFGVSSDNLGSNNHN